MCDNIIFVGMPHAVDCQDKNTLYTVVITTHHTENIYMSQNNV